MGSKEFTLLTVWQEAHRVRLAVFTATNKPPLARIFRWASQMQSAAHSIPANIAEGFGRRHPKDKARGRAQGPADLHSGPGVLEGQPPRSEHARGSLQDAPQPDR